MFLSHHGRLYDFVPGAFGVTVFFVLSGYLITTLLRQEFDRLSTIRLKQFYVRRALRILPLFYVVLTLAAIAGWLGMGGHGVNVSTTLAQAAHIGNYWEVFNPGDHPIAGTGVYWSLAIEEHFYLVFPGLFLLANRRGTSLHHQAIALASVSAVVLVWRCVLVYGMNAPHARTYYSTDTRIDALLIGCAAALVANPVRGGYVANARRLGAWAIAGAAAIVVSVGIRNEGFRETLRYSMQPLAMVAVMRYVIAVPRSLAGRILNWAPVAWIGRISYGFYLVHFAVVLEVGRHVQGLAAQVLLSLAISVPLGWGVHLLTDGPARRVRERMLRRLDTAPTRRTFPHGRIGDVGPLVEALGANDATPQKIV